MSDTFDKLVASTEHLAEELGLNNAVPEEYTADFERALRDAIVFGQGRVAPLSLTQTRDLKGASHRGRPEPVSGCLCPSCVAASTSKLEAMAKWKLPPEDFCGCASCEELQSMEDVFCIESDYDDTSEEHPVGNALARLQKAATRASVDQATMTQHKLECPHCRRQFGEMWLPMGVAAVYKVNCRGCELEGRA